MVGKGNPGYPKETKIKPNKLSSRRQRAIMPCILHKLKDRALCVS